MTEKSFGRLVAGMLPAVLSMTVSCTGSKADDPVLPTTSNTVEYVTDSDKLKMIYSLKDMEGDKGRFYSLDYTCDYQLDKALDAEAVNLTDLTKFLFTNLLDVTPTKASAQFSFGAGCSAYAATEASSGRFLMGRNYDFCHKNKQNEAEEIAAILVRTAPKGGKKSISMVDGYFIGFKRGFFTDKKTDLSYMMVLPYVPLDGINEDGFAIGILKLDGFSARENKEGKALIGPTVAIRMLLDRASDVDEAIALLQEYNMDMDTMGSGEASYHFFMADAKGKFAIVEYAEPDGNIGVRPWKINILNDSDEYRYTTNFYNSPSMAGTEYGGLSKHGRDRYDTLRNVLTENGFSLGAESAFDLLKKVAQASDPQEPTSQTQWSALFDLSRKKMLISVLRDWDSVYELDVK